MNNLRVLCWIWIVGSIIVILFRAPVSVTRQESKSRPQVTTIEWIGPFKKPLGESLAGVTKSSIDFSRLLVAILAANFLPSVLLWQHDEVVRWLNAQQRHRATSDQSPNSEMLAAAHARREAVARKLPAGCVICLLTIGVFLFGVLIRDRFVFLSAGSKDDDQAQTRAVAPNIPSDHWIPIPADGWVDISPTPTPISPTPTPIRRAIPVTR
jgi:hypothetical protein